MFTFMFLLIQDAGTPVAEAVKTVAPNDPADLQKYLKTCVDAVQSGNWQAAAALALVLCVFALRKYAPKMHGVVGAWLNTDRGGSLLVAAAGMACAVATAALAKQKITFNLVLTGFTTGAMASGLRDFGWNFFFPADKPAAPPATKLTEVAPPAEEKKP